MWCIGVLTPQYRQRMYELRELYARPFRAREPVLCVDEKSKQLLGEVRTPLPTKPGAPGKADGEYIRAGTCNLFVAVEPEGGRGTVVVTERRAKTDFVAFVEHWLTQVYATARRVHLLRGGARCPGRADPAAPGELPLLHYTPKHGSWLNMAEIEIGILDRQLLATEVAAWERRRNDQCCGIAWTFTRQNADRKMARHYVS
ncbi:MAG: transposase [Casimicrobiaceae bacterium]